MYVSHLSGGERLHLRMEFGLAVELKVTVAQSTAISKVWDFAISARPSLYDPRLADKRMTDHADISPTVENERITKRQSVLWGRRESIC